MGDVFQEVDEEVRRDRLQKIWKDYGAYLITAVVAIVLGTVASVGWREYTDNRQNDESNQFSKAISMALDGKYEDAVNTFQLLAKEGQDGYAILARFRVAGALRDAGNEDAAIQMFEKIAVDPSSQDLYRDLAALLVAMHKLDDEEPEQVRGRLMPLMKPEGAWRHSARELSGALALREGNLKLAKSTFKNLANDVLVPPGIKARMTQILRMIDN